MAKAVVVELEAPLNFVFGFVLGCAVNLRVSVFDKLQRGCLVAKPAPAEQHQVAQVVIEDPRVEIAVWAPFDEEVAVLLTKA